MQAKLSFPVSTMLEFFDRDNDSPQILIYGDSVMERISKYDGDTRTLSEAIAECLDKKLCMGCISHSGYHMGTFYQLSRLLKLLPQKPSTVVLPINMRSFSPQWDLHPLHQRVEHICTIQDYLNFLDPDCASPPSDIDRETSSASFLSTQVEYQLTPYQFIYEFENIIKSQASTQQENAFRRQQIFIYHYLYQLDKQHRKLQLLKKTLAILQSLNINIISYITPINYLAAKTYIGDRFLEYFKENLKSIYKIFNEAIQSQTARIFFNDYSLLLDSNCFFHLDDPTEHLNEKGRKILAEMISELCLDL
ncbi:MAG: hypothetical protein MUD14_09960 [Hydrococcus sp. Prado102]|jgi:hypothetical protein|nr:hypothetical protein [Hydrococcus sp. Prado102]